MRVYWSGGITIEDETDKDREILLTAYKLLELLQLDGLNLGEEFSGYEGVEWCDEDSIIYTEEFD